MFNVSLGFIVGQTGDSGVIGKDKQHDLGEVLNIAVQCVHPYSEGGGGRLEDLLCSCRPGILWFAQEYGYTVYPHNQGLGEEIFECRPEEHPEEVLRKDF